MTVTGGFMIIRHPFIFSCRRIRIGEVGVNPLYSKPHLYLGSPLLELEEINKCKKLRKADLRKAYAYGGTNFSLTNFVSASSVSK